VNGTQQLLVYADDAYGMREYMDTKQEHSFFGFGKVVSLEVNVGNLKCLCPCLLRV
jgi:hypothetical protein